MRSWDRPSYKTKDVRAFRKWCQSKSRPHIPIRLTSYRTRHIYEEPGKGLHHTNLESWFHSWTDGHKRKNVVWKIGWDSLLVVGAGLILKETDDGNRTSLRAKLSTRTIRIAATKLQRCNVTRANVIDELQYCKRVALNWSCDSVARRPMERRSLSWWQICDCIGEATLGVCGVEHNITKHTHTHKKKTKRQLGRQ